MYPSETYFYNFWFILIFRSALVTELQKLLFVQLIIPYDNTTTYIMNSINAI